MNQEVVITGMGVVTPYQDFWDSIKKGSSVCAAQIDYTRIQKEAEAILKGDRLRTVNFDSKIVAVAFEKALKDAGINLKKVDRSRIAISAGVSFGSMESYESFQRSILNNNREPSSFSNSLASVPIAVASLNWEITGQCLLITGDFSVGAEAILHGADLIQSGICDYVIAGGWEFLSSTVSEKYRLSGSLSSKGICRPFDQEREGLILSEGAGFLVIESLENAIKREKIPYATLKGFGTGGGPTKNEIMAAMKSALIQNDNGRIDYILASANSSVEPDKEEAIAIKELFGGAMPVTSIKSTLGETLGASGSLSVICAALSMRDGVIPPTVNFKAAEKGCEINVLTKPVVASIDSALVNSVGSNVVSIVLTKDYRKVTGENDGKNAGN